MNEKNLALLEHVQTYDDYREAFFKEKENPKRFVVRVVDRKTGDQIKSITIPTIYYPLHNNNFKVFSRKNCKEAVDKKVHEIFDSVEYRVGCCYTMADELKSKLTDAGYDAKIYTGWLLIGEGDDPVHHCWIMLGDSLLDISDDFTLMYTEENIKNFENASKEESRRAVAEFKKTNQKAGLTNSQRCAPVGIPFEMLCYIGCEVSCGKEAKALYNRMLKEVPDHPDNKRPIISRTQQMVLNQMA